MRAAEAGWRSNRLLCITGIAVLVAAIVAAAACLYSRRIAQMAHRVQLPDGTEVFFRGSLPPSWSKGYPHPRELSIDGDAFVRAPGTGVALTIRTRLMVLKVSEGSAFRVTAYWKQAGEEVEVLFGHVQVSKSYRSSYSTPDELSGGEMSMVNGPTDLMEKERTDLDALRAWSEQLARESAAHR